MRFLAGIYLAIALANFGFWLNNGLEVELFPNPSAYLTWTLYLLIMLSLFAFTIRKQILPQRVWQIVFVVFCTTRMYELATRGLTLSGVDMASDLNIITSYLWLVLPPGMAMWYMGFMFRTPEKTSKRPSKKPSIQPLLQPSIQPSIWPPIQPPNQYSKQSLSQFSNQFLKQPSKQASKHRDHETTLHPHYTEQLP